MSRHLPQFLRFVERLRSFSQPLIEVRGWPESGRHALLTALAAAVPVRYLDRRGSESVTSGDLRELLADAGRSSGCWFVIDGELDRTAISTIAERLSRDQRLIFSYSREMGDAELPTASVRARELLLTPAELEELWLHTRKEAPAAKEIEQLFAATEGWYGPLTWLLNSQVSPSEALHSHAFRERFDQHILGRLAAPTLDLLLEVALVERFDNALWRELWRRDPARLEALDTLGEWSLPVISGVSQEKRLPTLLVQALVALRRATVSPEEERESYRCLGLAAGKLGRQALALRCFTQAGQVEETAELLEREAVVLLDQAPLTWVGEALDALPSTTAQRPAIGLWRALVALDQPRGQKEASPVDTEELASPALSVVARLLGLLSGNEAPGRSIDGAHGPTALEKLAARLQSGGGERRSSGVRSRALATITQQSFVIELLGRARLCQLTPGGEEIELSCSLRKAFQVIAYLALAPGRRAPKQELIAAIWPDAGLDAIRKNFHPTLSAVRRTFDPEGQNDPLILQQGLYCLHPELDWRLDVARFKRRIDEGRMLLDSDEDCRPQALAVWLEAWRMYRGPLLEDFEADWIEEQRQALQRRYLTLLRDLGKLCAETGRAEQALDAYRSVLFEDPFDERVHLALMELYANQGRRDLVRRQYLRLQNLLKELAVEPLPETQELYHQLMR